MPLESESAAEAPPDVLGLPLDSALSEMLDCARYGDLPELKAFLDHASIDVNHRDGGGNTALHKACANGHVDCVKVILEREGVHHVGNDSGNTPLHWACSNAKPDIVKLLLDKFEGIDVLKKNEFGISALTEGFKTDNTDLIRMLLEHDSASEDKLLAGDDGLAAKVKIDDGGDRGDQDQDQGVSNSEPPPPQHTTHEFSLGAAAAVGGKKKHRTTITVRELAMTNADNPFTTKVQDDTTGLAIWAASVVFGRFLAKLGRESNFDGSKILELGGGCGVPGIAAASYGSPSRVDITDLNADTIENLNWNIQQNKGNYSSCKVTGYKMDWSDSSTWPSAKVDVLIGADLVYTKDIVPLLLGVINAISCDDAVFYYCAPQDSRAGLTEFIDCLRDSGWTLEMNEVAGEEYLSNPLTSGDDDMMFLCFNELIEKTFVLYKFTKGEGDGGNRSKSEAASVERRDEDSASAPSAA